MRRIGDIAFAAIACLALLLPLLNVAAGALLDGYETKENSSLEGRAYRAAPEPSPESFASKEFQDQTEGFLADHVPERDGVMLANASVQRTLIEAANLPFGFPAYHSFYGSDRVVLPEYRAIVQEPTTASSADADALHAQADALGALVGRHPSVQWRIALVDRTDVTRALPTHGMVAQPADYGFLQAELLDRLPAECIAVDLSNDDADEYFRKYFRTDHHWQIEGAVDAYAKTVSSLGKEPIDVEFFEVNAGPFYGSNARSGLFTGYADTIDDARFELGDLAITANEQDRPIDWLDAGYAEGFTHYSKADEFDDVYGGYFHGGPAMLHIVNRDIPDGETILLVADSYSNNVEDLFACNYRDVYVVDPRHFAGSDYAGWDIDAFIEHEDVSAVVFLCSANNFADDIGILLPNG